MCDVCHMNPHHPKCPYAPEPPAIYICACCGEPIVRGDEFLELDGDYYHLEDCANEIAMDLLLDKCGARKGVAEADQWE